MLLSSRVWGLALVAAAAAISSPLYGAEATHAPVWDPAMAAVPADSAAAPVDTVSTQENEVPSVKLTLYNVRDAIYYAKIAVGSPPQSVRVAFDTAASDLAVLAIKSEGHLNFNDSKSLTFQSDGRSVKLRDTSTGVLARDRVVLHEGAAVDNQFFTEINNVTMFGPYYKDLRFDGWFGLAPRTTQSVGEVPAILQSLFSNHVVANPVVGISMPKGENGYVSFGSFNNQLTAGEMTHIAQPHPGLWTHPVDKIDVGGKPIHVPVSSPTHAQGTTSFAVLDTVELFIAGPPGAVEAIAKAVGAKQNSRLPGMWTVSCAAPMHDITFWSGEHPLTVTVNEMVGIQVSQTDCLFMMRSWYEHETPLGDWGFGLPVFHRYFFGFGYNESRRLGYALHPQ